MAKVVSVEARTVHIPLRVATAFARRKVTSRDYSLVKIRTDDGIEGIGHCYAGHSGGNVVTTAVREMLAPMLIGVDPYATELHWKNMYQEVLLHGRVGSVMRALSILDTALWDRNARAANLPLYKYLGAAYEDTVPAYASGGYYLDGKTPEMLGEEMAGYVALGLDAVKMKVGRGDLRSEEARIAAARKAIGPDVLLMLDANNAWSDVPTALRFMERYAPYDPYWIEEPFNPDQIDNHAKLAAAISIPVATGEIEAGRWRFKELLDKQAASILQPDAAGLRRHHGIPPHRRVGRCLRCHHLPPLVPRSARAHGGGLAQRPIRRILPRRKSIQLPRDYRPATKVHNGGLALTTEPGLGYLFDEKAIARYQSDDWG